MPVTHRAYTFNPLQFHKEVEDRSIIENRFSLDALLKWARYVVSDASEATRETLRYLRFDPEWLDPTDNNVFSTDLYIIVLAKYLFPAPSLSNRLHSYAILELILPLAGWTDSQIQLLLRGRQLHTLLEFSANPIFIAEFRDVDQYGGWIETEDAKELISKITIAQQHFLSPGEKELQVLDKVSKFPVYQQQSLQEILRKAYEDATEMLETSIKRNEALFIIFD